MEARGSESSKDVGHTTILFEGSCDGRTRANTVMQSSLLPSIAMYLLDFERDRALRHDPFEPRGHYFFTKPWNGKLLSIRR